MALSKIEGERNTATEPVRAFMHNRDNPPEGLDDRLGNIVPYVRPGREPRLGPPIATIEDTSLGTEIILEEQSAVTEMLESSRKARAARKAQEQGRLMQTRHALGKLIPSPIRVRA